MANELAKYINSKRRHRDEVAVKKQLKIAKQSHYYDPNHTSVLKQPHRLNKRHAMDCGNPGCYMCGNRRRHEGITAQEKRLFQDLDNVRDIHGNGIEPTED